MSDQFDKNAFEETVGGIRVQFCIPNSPAFRAGVRNEDVLLFVNDVMINDHTEYLKARLLCATEMKVTVVRDGEHLDFSWKYDRPITISEPAEPEDEPWKSDDFGQDLMA